MAILSGMETALAPDNREWRVLRGQMLNLVAAAEAHVVWKARLGHHVLGTIREVLEPDLLGEGGFCQLGTWINGMASEPFRDTGEYLRLSEAHRQFHSAGARIIGRLREGDREGAARLFDGEYSAALRGILQALAELNRRFHAVNPAL